MNQDPERFSRRALLAAGAALAGAQLTHPLRALANEELSPLAKPKPPVTLPTLDQAMQQFMTARNVPGGALAVVRKRQLIYAKGYGVMDTGTNAPVTPASLFRIASLSKCFTGVGILKLVEQGLLNLDQKAFPLLALSPLASAGALDTRLQDITISQLLHHTAGFDRDASFDPMFYPGLIAQAAGVPSPPDPVTIIRYMLGRPLDFTPGSKYAYSNFGYCVLGRVIEKVTGTPYAQWMAQNILKPAGITKMYIGASLASRPGEVTYYAPADGLANNVFPTGPSLVPWPYGGFNLEALDAHGGWVASVVDLARFAAALDDPKHSPLLKSTTFTGLYAPPPPPVWRNANGSLQGTWYGSGWLVQPVPGTKGYNYLHDGSLPGTATTLVRRWDGVSFAAAFNQRSDTDTAITNTLFTAINGIKKWPTGNLFSTFP